MEYSELSTLRLSTQIQMLLEQNRKLDAILSEGCRPGVVPELAGGMIYTLEKLYSVRQ